MVFCKGRPRHLEEESACEGLSAERGMGAGLKTRVIENLEDSRNSGQIRFSDCGLCFGLGWCMSWRKYWCEPRKARLPNIFRCSGQSYAADEFAQQNCLNASTQSWMPSRDSFQASHTREHRICRYLLISGTRTLHARLVGIDRVLHVFTDTRRTRQWLVSTPHVTFM